MKEVDFEEREIPAFADEMLEVTGSASAPQIVVHGVVVGSFEELGSLELRGELDRLLRRD
jgi:glutaredoxin